MNRKSRIIVIIVVTVHIALLAAYTFPERLVPRSVAYLAQAYARPLFHQRWELFAPDPPLCSCEVQVRVSGDWRPLHASDAHYLTRRLARTISWHVQREVLQGRDTLSIELQQAMRSMVRDIGRDTDHLRFRLMEECITEPSAPTRREERITSLELR